ISFEKDEWLADIFHSNAYRLKIPPTILDDDELTLPKLEAGFYTARISTSAINDLRFLMKNGFYVVDVNVTLDHEIAKNQVRSKNKSVVIRTATPSDKSPVKEIAFTAFRYSRFHLDPQIPKPIANKVKKDWVENCLDKKRGNQVYVAAMDGFVAGF